MRAGNLFRAADVLPNMNRLILGIVLLLTAIWLARADDKSAAGPEKITPARANGVALKFVPAEK